MSVTHGVPSFRTREHLLALMLAVTLTAFVALLYVRAAYAPTGDAPLMPVDDAYIHFQYARQLAEGKPYVYNDGYPPTSGATSLLYPYVLAVGYLLGFQALNLGLWAMLVGGVALALSGWSVYHIGRRAGVDFVPSVLLQSAMILNGALSWHAFSGMETALVVLFTLLTFEAFMARDQRRFVLVAIVLALLRPDASVLAAIASVLYAVLELAESRRFEPRLLWLVLPIAAVGVQPALNLLITGAASASGGQAKSLLGMIPAYPDVMMARIVENFTRMASELFIGVGAFDIWYMPPPLAPIALAGALVLMVRGRWRGTVALAALWIVVLMGAVSTLDTAFWHFKRYQMPIHALLFPLLALCLPLLRRRGQIILTVFATFMALLTLSTFVDFYTQNTASVAAQPLAMARALPTLTPPDAVIAVHDVGMMRYMGQRTTLDMVGLTTEGAADYWRHGPGAVAEYLGKARPSHIAAYTDARGLSYLAATSLYGQELAGFPHPLDARANVALGGDFQGIYAADYVAFTNAVKVYQPQSLLYIDGWTLVDTLNVADLADEAAHGYVWSNRERLDGFATEVYEFTDAHGLPVLDGGRRINGEESFTLRVLPNQDALLITRIHPFDGGTFDVFANGLRVSQRVIPVERGRWLEVLTHIPSALVTDETLTIRIVPHISGGHYMPYHHWLYSGTLTDAPPQDSMAQYQEGAIHLMDVSVQIEGAGQAIVTLTWWGNGHAQGDWVRFVHLYNDLNAPPVAQVDTRPLDGYYTPANWVMGTFVEQVAVQLPDNVSDTLQLAVGFYHPTTFERLNPSSVQPDLTVESGRLLLGSMETRARD